VLGVALLDDVVGPCPASAAAHPAAARTGLRRRTTKGF
jgi:hypothetical protein